MKKGLLFAFALLFLFVMVARVGHSASIREADDAYWSGDNRSAIEAYSELAEAGNVEAMEKLSHIYESGALGGKQFIDLEKAFFWAKMAAEAGEPDAQLRLAGMYAEGLGDIVAQDREAAANWYGRAYAGYMARAQKGNALAMYQVAIMLGAGRGVSVNLQSAHDWMRKAANLGIPSAIDWLSISYVVGRGVSKSDVEARKWLRRGVEIGSRPLDEILRDLQDGTVGCDAYVKVHELAAAAGDLSAANRLAFAYVWSGTFQSPRAELLGCVKRDFVSAHRVLIIGARMCDAYSMEMLGDLYQRGWGVPVSYQEAYKWYLRAANQGGSSAMNSLGIMFSEGEGVPQNYVLAHMWFNLSSAQTEKDIEVDVDPGAHNRSSLEDKMSTDEILRAQRMAVDWKPSKSCIPAPAGAASGKRPGAPAASGGVGAAAKSSRQELRKATGE